MQLRNQCVVSLLIDCRIILLYGFSSNPRRPRAFLQLLDGGVQQQHMRSTSAALGPPTATPKKQGKNGRFVDICGYQWTLIFTDNH